MIDSVNALSDGFNTIGKIYFDVKDSGAFDFSFPDSKNFKETFSDFDREYNAFIEKVSSSPDNIEGRRDAFSSLISKWVESKDIYFIIEKTVFTIKPTWFKRADCFFYIKF